MTVNSRTILSFFLLAAVTAIGEGAEKQANASGPVHVVQLQVSGPIGPATNDYVSRSLDRAERQHASLAILLLDTPGGLDLAMRDIVRKILASQVPVAAFVAPGGARAASAGTYILYASHIAAMAPATNVGSATPVQIGAPGVPAGRNEPSDEDRKKGGSGHDDANALRTKTLNDAAAYLQGLAKLRGRNESWADKAVRQGANVTAEDALKLKVIDLIATNQLDLLRKLEGRTVHVLAGEVKLSLTGAVIDVLSPDWRNQLLAVITDPNVAYILMLLGIYGLLLEFYHPGAVLPGTVGGISLLLALYAFQVIPFNYAGLALILLGIALMVAEAFVASFGALGLGGVTAFVIGSVILMDTDIPGFSLNPGVIAAFALASLLFFVMLLGLIVRARRSKVVSGREELIGSTATALGDFVGAGRVRVHCEIWNAQCVLPVRRGDQVLIEALEGLTLVVTPTDRHKGD